MKPDRWLLIHGGVVLFGLVGFLIWACLAPLTEGVTTGGQIIVEQNRKTLQHLEGGIIRGIFVEEGDAVESGELLYEIDALAITADRDQVELERSTLLANADRINALLSDADTLDFTSRERWKISLTDQESIASEQANLFDEQRESFRSRRQLLGQRIQSLKVGQEQRDAQRTAIEGSLSAVDRELMLTADLVEEKLAQANELYRLEREKARLASERASLSQRNLEVGSQILEIEKEIMQVRAEFREQLSRELVETRTAIAKADEQLKAIDDAVFRSKVVAPASGQVMNVRFTTVGGVVQPGEPMLEIVPQTSGAWATIQISPNDRETVTEGMAVRVQLTGFKSWQTPDIRAEIRTISADLKQIPETGMSFYEARILLNDTDLETSNLPRILPGMPIQAFIPSQNSRTLADYLIEPIYAHFRKGMSSG